MSAPFLEIYDSTDTTLQSSVISDSGSAGNISTPVPYHLWNDKGASHSSSTLKNALMIVEAKNALNVWVRSGVPILDEAWVQVSITGQNNIGNPLMTPQTTAYKPLGTNRPLILNDIPPNCARYFSLRVARPAGANTATQSFRIGFLDDQLSFPLSEGVGVFGRGILPDYMDRSIRRLRSGRALSAVGTAIVTVAKGGWTYDGERVFRISETLTLNQTAANGALASGQSYIAVISQPANAAPVATKGNKAASPSAPAIPVGDIYLGQVTVPYQAGGSSVINNSNIDITGVVYGEYLPYAGGGLTLIVGAGKSITSVSTATFSGSSSSTYVSDESYHLTWLLPDGTLSNSTDTSLGHPPFDGAIPLAYVATHGGAITNVYDVRPFAGEEFHVTLSYHGLTSTTDDLIDVHLIPYAGLLESYIVLSPITAVADDVKVDIFSIVNNVSATLFTSNGSSDLRPVIPSGSLRVSGSDNEVISLPADSLIYFSFSSITDSAADGLTVVLKFRMSSEQVAFPPLPPLPPLGP